MIKVITYSAMSQTLDILSIINYLYFQPVMMLRNPIDEYPFRGIVAKSRTHT